ncbi:MAG: prolyl oligopeptidase family serine peptidase [Candidatus Eisenbacteria bacterium]
MVSFPSRHPRAGLMDRLQALAVAGPLFFACAFSAQAHPAEPPQPRFEIAPLEVAASPELLWNFDLTLVNPTSTGLFADSLFCRIEDMGRGATHADRVRISSLPAIAQGFGALSAGDSVRYQHSVPATCETGTLSFELFCHRTDGSKVSIQSTKIQLTPGPVSAQHPSEFLTVGGRKVEVMVFPSRKEGLAPGLLFIHDEASHARLLMATGLQLSARGYTVLFASMPGYGLSEGSPDSAGPRTVAALGAALDRLKRVPGVDATRLAAWGVSRGASAVAKLAARRTDLAAVIAQSGFYEPLAAGKARAPTLVLHGGADAHAPADQARAFAAALEKSGTPVESRFLSGAGHTLSRSDAQRAAFAFLEARLKR